MVPKLCLIPLGTMLSLLQVLRKPSGGGPPGAGHQVPADIHRDHDGSVPQGGLNALGVHASRDHEDRATG